MSKTSVMVCFTRFL